MRSGAENLALRAHLGGEEGERGERWLDWRRCKSLTSRARARAHRYRARGELLNFAQMQLLQLNCVLHDAEVEEVTQSTPRTLPSNCGEDVQYSGAWKYVEVSESEGPINVIMEHSLVRSHFGIPEGDIRNITICE